jgi:hypothetical protein
MSPYDWVKLGAAIRLLLRSDHSRRRRRWALGGKSGDGDGRNNPKSTVTRRSVEEFLAWQRSIDRYGVPGLRVTRLSWTPETRQLVKVEPCP